jgi:cell division inhibitor SulA
MRVPALRSLVAGLSLLLLGMGSLQAEDSAPLFARIDQLIAAAAGGPLAVQSPDAEFCRRVYLDLAGRIPSIEESKAFLADGNADKRTKLIDRLLASDDHVRRFSQALLVMLMERLGDHEDWQKLLRESVKANKPWDQLVRELLNPNPDDEATRGSALWYTKRLENYGQNPVDIPALVRDVGRQFLGIDVQCAQCHDHLFVDEYKKDFYHGMLAFVGNTSIRQDVKFPAVALKPLEKKVEFMSVFVQQPKSVGPKLPFGQEIDVPTFAKGEEFELPPDKKNKFPGTLKFNTLKLLSEQLPRADNKLFTKNIANRLWWLMLGRGLVEPLDLSHAGNPPSHPELLELLAGELAAHQFDMRWLIREIALSQAYQRSSVAADDAAAEVPAAKYRVGLEKQLSSEQLLASIRQALGDGKPLVIDLADKTWTDWQVKFDKALANPPREPEVGHNPTVKAALFFMNDSVVLGWIKPNGENLAARLPKQADAGALADELYLAVLSRRPTDEEKKEVADFLVARTDRREKAVTGLIWGLLASNEFCANH